MSSQKENKRSVIGSMRVSSIGALVVTLNILAAIAFLRIITKGVERSIKEQIAFDIELTDSYTQEDINALCVELKQVEGIDTIEHISADSALQYIRDRHNEDPVKLLGYNPMQSVLRAYLQSEYTQLDSLRKIQEAVQPLGLDIVGLNTEQEANLQVINRNMGIVQGVLLLLFVVQGILSYIQVSNITSIMIYTERLQIRTLLLVGASFWFIFRPIVSRSLMDGFIAYLVSLLSGVLALGVLDKMLEGVGIIDFLLEQKTSLILSVVLIGVLALVSTGIASYFSIQRYVKMNAKDINII